MSSRTETTPAPSATRWTTSAAIVAGWVLVVLALVYFLEIRPHLRTEAPSVDTVPTVQAGFPAPPVGAVVYSREMGEDALALGVVPGAEETIVQASVVGPQGEGVSGLDVAFTAQGSTVSGRSCGAGCYRAALPAVGPPKTIEVAVDGDDAVRWSVALPTSWPPRDGDRTVTRAERVWRSLRSLSFEETLRSSPTNVVTSSWQLQAPDKLAYQIVDGASAVIVGKHRWDKAAPGKAWRRSPALPIHQPTPPWVDAVNARVVGTRVTRGRPSLVVTFFDPKTPGWYTATLDRETLRTYDVRMVATAHFMHDRMHSFDDTAPVLPPT